MPTAPLILALALATQAPAKPFVSEAGGFRVALPGTPKEKVQSVPGINQPIEIRMFLVERGDASYGATFCDYPEAIALADPDRVLEGGIEGALKNLKGKLLAKRNITLQGHPGREFSASFTAPNKAPGLYRARAYLVGARLYQVILCGPEAEIAGDAGDRIFKSFALLRPPPPPPPVKPLAAGKAYVSPEGRFRVRFPESPRENVLKAPSPAGPIEIHMAAVDRGDIAYIASYNDCPFDPKAIDPDSTLETAVRGSLQSSKGTLRSKRDIRLGDHPGKACEIALPLPDGRPSTCRSRVYLVGKRLYQVVVIEAKGQEDPKVADAFLDSFALLKPPSP